MLFRLIWPCAFVAVVLGASLQVGQKFQIILSSVPTISNSTTKITPSDAEVWDIDAFEAEPATIAALQGQGKTVLCYFSAGTYEEWRPDKGNFTAADKGRSLAPDWPNEYWLKLDSANVRRIMTTRIQMAYTKGCDGIDPDNTDGYQNPSGNMTVTRQDSIDYIRWMAGIAKGLNMTVGLKNSMNIIPDVGDVVAFAVNEQCALFGECTEYSAFLASGKPVFHIEYPDKLPANATDRTSKCVSNPAGLSTILKNNNLDGPASYCDGSYVITDTKPGNPNIPPPKGPKTSTTRPTSTPKPTSSKTTSRTTTTSNKTTSTSRPTTSTSSQAGPTTSPSGGPSGCTAKHWDQCGGKDWKGCTVCASGFSCKVSNPYYSQCL